MPAVCHKLSFLSYFAQTEKQFVGPSQSAKQQIILPERTDREREKQEGTVIGCHGNVPSAA